MEIKKKKIQAIFEKINKRAVLIVVGFLVLAGAGITYYFAKADTLVDGAQVSVSASTKLKYGTSKDKVTYRYSVSYTQGGAGSHEAICAEPEKTTPKGTKSEVYIMEGGNETEIKRYELIKRILLTTRIGKDASIEYNGETFNAYSSKKFPWANYVGYTNYSDYSGSLTAFDYTSIALGHALVGYVYSGSVQGFGQSFANDYWGNRNGDSELLKTIWDIFEEDGYKQLAESAQLRRSEGETGSKNNQDLIWLENVPQSSETGRLGVNKVFPMDYASLIDEYPERYTVSGAVFEVYEASSCSGGEIVDDGRVDGAVGWSGMTCSNPIDPALVTGSDGKTTEMLTLPVGTYYIKEVSAPTGFGENELYYELAILDGDTIWLDIEDDPIVGGIKLKKVDSETLLVTPQGMAKLQGARFQINDMTKARTVTDSLYSDENGIVEYSGLPEGNYQIFEIEAGEGYITPSRDSVTRINFSISADGSNNLGDEAIEYENKVMRGDVKFTKKKTNYLGGDGGGQAGIPFLIQLLDSGEVVEQHVIVSDENGVVDTSARRGVRVNVNDTTFLDGDAIKDISGVRSSSLDKTAGVWFGEGEHGVNDSYRQGNGALVYGDYRVVELKIADNMIYEPAEGSDIAFTFSVNENGKVVGGAGDEVINVVNNIKDRPELNTIASAVEGESNAGTRTREIEIGENITVYDYVRYSGLVAGQNYTIIASLTDEEGGTVLDEGEPVSGYVNFTAGAGGSGVANVRIEDVDSSRFVGKELTVNEILYWNPAGDTDSRVLVGKHLDPESDEIQDASIEAMSETENTNQTVKVKTAEIVRTTATASDKSSKEVNVGFVEVYDAITVKGLVNGKTYVVKTWVVDEDGNRVRIWDETGLTGQDDISREINYDGTTAEEKTIWIDKIYVDTTEYVGKKLIVYQELSDEDGNKSTHPNNNSSEEEIARETVVVRRPEIGTIAYDGDGTSLDDTEIKISETAKIKDKVSYENLEAGTKYYLSWKVVDVETDNVVKEASVKEEVESGSDKFWTVDITVDTRNYVGKKLAVYEYLYAKSSDSEWLVKHEDKTDAGKQVVTVAAVSIETMARNADNTETQEVGVGKVNIIDYVKYTGLTVGEKYRLAAELRKEDGAKVSEAVSEPFTAVTDGVNNPASVTFYNINTKDLIGETLYVTEVVYTGESGGVEVARHEENVESQRIYVKTPEIETMARNADNTETQEVGVGKVNIVDYVKYTGLTVGEECWLKATLRREDGSEIVTIRGDKITTVEDGEANPASVTFMNVETADLIGKTVYITEILYHGESGDETYEIARHEENVTEQQIKVKTPTIETLAYDGLSGDESDKEIEVLTDAKIKDKIRVTGLVKGETYSLVSQLADNAEEAEGFVDVERAYPVEITAGDDGSAEVEVEFMLDTLGLRGKELTAMEWVIYDGNKEVVKHVERTESQTVQVKNPELTTEAKSGSLVDEKNGEKVVRLDKEAKIIDTARYTGLAEGVKYRAFGVLYDQDTGEKLLIDGKEITASDEFEAGENGAGEVELTFTLDTSDIPGKNIVVFEYIYYKESEEGEEVEIIKHEDIESTEQWVEVQPKVGTKVIDEIDGDQAVGVGMATVVDTVKYEGLKVGAKYKVRGMMMDRKTGEEIGVEEESEEFIVTEEMGTTNEKDVKVKFVFETAEIQGRSLVVFEELYEIVDEEEVLRAVHKDLGDKAQWIDVKTARVATIAVDGDDGDKELDLEKEALITDTVEYYGLVKGEKYKLVGILMDKETGTGLGVMENMIFTAEAENGTVNLDFVIDTTEMSGKEIVVFETLHYIDEDEEEIEIAKHQDLEDSSQTVWVKVKTPNTGMFGSVSDGGAVVRVVYAAAAIGALGAVYAVVNRKRKIRF